jgi:hypothetical protein
MLDGKPDMKRTPERWKYDNESWNNRTGMNLNIWPVRAFVVAMIIVTV